MSTHPTKSLVLSPSSAFILPIFSRPLPAAILTGPLTARTTVGNPIILVYDPANAYTSLQYEARNRAIDEGLSVSCGITFRPCPGIRVGVFTDLALFNDWIAKTWGLPPESGVIAPIVVLGRRDITRGGTLISLRDMDIRADANFAADPDTNTRPTTDTPSVPTPGGVPTPAATRTNNTPVWAGTLQVFGRADCGACAAAMNYFRSLGVPAERVEITSAEDSRLVSALSRASASIRGGFSAPLIIHTKGTPRVTQGFNVTDLRARYFVGAPVPEVPAPRPPTPALPEPIAPVFTSTFVGPLTYTFATEGTMARSWSFGDATTSVELNPTHTYAAPGTYTVSLRMPADSTSVTTSTLDVLATGTSGTITTSTPPAPSSKSSNTFPFIVGVGLMYGMFSLWRKLRR